MILIRAVAVALAVMIALAACAQEEEHAALRLPKKEATWVRTEKVKTTKDELLARKDGVKFEIPVNEELEKKLVQAGTSGRSAKVSDKDSCLSRTRPLDNQRTAVQKAGGMWHAFERNPQTKSHSDHGMQLDSQTNKLVFALMHLCKTAKGIPLDAMEQWVRESVKTHGEKQAIENFADMANEGDAKVWIEQAKIAKQNESRSVDYKTIAQLIDRAEPLIGFYTELMQRNVDDGTADAFLSDSITLLKLINSLITGDRTLVMALKEDESDPFYNLESEM